MAVHRRETLVCFRLLLKPKPKCIFRRLHSHSRGEVNASCDSEPRQNRGSGRFMSS